MKSMFKIVAALLLLAITAHAQKLPKVQTSSVWAPANIKIDGKTTEWNGQFQAHNFGNHIYYTISNDDNNLYFTACMDDKAGDAKIFKGGITFTVIPLDKKAEKISVTFPVITRKKGINMEDGRSGRVIDSISSANSGLTKTYKDLYVTGLPEVTDPYLSIYNAEGIRVGASLEKQKRYTYELAIPLKYLEAAISEVKTIKYNIRLNAVAIDFSRTIDPSAPVIVLKGPIIPPSIDDMFNYEDSDFSGVYTLALKP